MRTEDILLAVKPRFSAMIKAGIKKVEIRKAFPKNSIGRRVYIYSSHPDCKILGYFHVSNIVHCPIGDLWERVKNISGLNRHEFLTYFSGKNTGTAVYFDEFTCLEKPITLAEIRKKHPLFAPPQNYIYRPQQITLGTAT